MDLTYEEKLALLGNPIYEYYAATPWTTHTPTTVQAHLDGITKTSLDTLPLIKFLHIVLDAVSKGTYYASLTTGTAQALFVKQTSIDNKQDILARHLSTLNPSQYGSNGSGGNVTAASNTLYRTAATLNAGALADHVLFQPGTGKKGIVYHTDIGIDTAALIAQNYTLDFQDEDNASFFHKNWVQTMDRVELHYIHATADKDIEVDILGGADDEILVFNTFAATYT